MVYVHKSRMVQRRRNPVYSSNNRAIDERDKYTCNENEDITVEWHMESFKISLI
jgi:hypothetical protein